MLSGDVGKYYQKIRAIEDDNYTMEQIIKYFYSDSDSYLDDIKDGMVFIPTANSLRKAKERMVLVKKSEAHLDKAIEYSEAFYYHFIKLVIESKYHKTNYNLNFTRLVIPYGLGFIKEIAQFKKTYHDDIEEKSSDHNIHSYFSSFFKLFFSKFSIFIISLCAASVLHICGYINLIKFLPIILSMVILYNLKSFLKSNKITEYDINGNHILAQEYRDRLLNLNKMK